MNIFLPAFSSYPVASGSSKASDDSRAFRAGSGSLAVINPTGIIGRFGELFENETMMALESGTKLGPYEILSPLGAGGMGEVYLANDAKLDRKVAIKVLPDSMTRDKERVARFEREAKLLASLNHPNIAAIHGFDNSDGTQFLVMEYVEGETLGNHLKKGPVAVEDALDMAKQMAEALEAAHEQGVIHRDLKPANIMVHPLQSASSSCLRPDSLPSLAVPG